MYLGFCMVVSLCCRVGDAADVYVSTRGDDAYTGTSGKVPRMLASGKPATSVGPFATIERAQQAVRAWKAKQPERTDPIVVEIGGGLYRLKAPLTFGPGDGSGNRTVLYTAATGQRPIISGGRRVGPWVEEGGIWQVKLAGDWRLNELFVNGRRATRARYPNDRYLRVETVGDDNRTSFTWNKGDLPALADPGPMQLVFLHDWSITRVRIKSLDAGTRRLTTAYPVGPHARHYRMNHFERHPRYYLENHVSFLDAPGEWRHDPATGILRYKPREGETRDNIIAVAPYLTKLLTVKGTADQPVRNLRFRGLTLVHCAYCPGERYAAGQAAFHEEGDAGGGLRIPTPAAVTFDFAEACEMQGCRVEHVGGSGVWIRQRNRRCALTGCAINDTGGNGVMIGEDCYRRVDGNGWCDAAPGQATTQCTLTDNTIERVGQRFYGAVGVWVGMANHITVAHNEVRNTPYTGISVGWMWNPRPTPCHHNIIEKNHIHHIMQTLSDGGGVYTLGRQPGARLIGNVIHDVPRNAGRAESNGMFLDQGTTDLLIADNIIYNVDRAPLRFHQCTTNISRNNVLVVPSGQPPYRYNNTNAEDITREGDMVIEWNTFDPGVYHAAIEAAGPRDHRAGTSAADAQR